MHSISRAITAALAVVVVALTLGFATSQWTASDAEAADQPTQVAAVSVVDADYCAPFSYGYFNPGIYGGFYPYTPSFGYPCYGAVSCPGPLVMWRYQLVCPGPPAGIEMPATTAVTCASATNLTVHVHDAIGVPVTDGTSVSFQVAPFGFITGTVGTNGGEATASLTTPTKTTGQLTVTVTAGSVTRTQTIDVSCSAPGSTSGGGGGGQSSAAQTQAPTYTPPAPMGGGGGGY